MIGWMVYAHLLDNSRDALKREIELTADRIDVRFESFSKEMDSYARLLADSAPIVDWFSRSESHLYGARIRFDVNALFGRVRINRPILSDLILVNRDGIEQFRFSSENEVKKPAPNISRSKWFKTVKSNWWSRSHLIIARDMHDGQNSLIITSQVRSKDAASIIGANSEVLGYVVIKVPIKDIVRDIGLNALGSVGYAVFMDDNLNLIDAPESYVTDAVAVRESLAEVSPNQPNLDVTTLEINGETRLVRQHQITDGLVAMVVLPTKISELFHHRIALKVALATGIAIIAFSCFFAWLAQAIVVRPINQLQSNITALSEGRHIPSKQSHRKDEIGELARSFSQMSQRLSESMRQLQDTSQRNEQLANHDGLTGLPNRRRFQTLLEASVNRASNENEQFAVMFIDLNKFKLLNDTLGHRAGDELLVTTANRLSESMEDFLNEKTCQPNTLEYQVARLAGDEFVVLLYGFQSCSIVATAADLLVDHLCRETIVENANWKLEASVGVALFPQHATTSESILACADQSMYEAKHQPRSCWRMYTAKKEASLRRAS